VSSLSVSRKSDAVIGVLIILSLNGFRLKFVDISLDMTHDRVHNKENSLFQSIHQTENALQGYCMVYQQNSAQTRSLHTDQSPISTISTPRSKVRRLTMTTRTPQCDESSEYTFASTLRHRRTTNSLSLAQLADRVGCAKSYLSSIENGHKGPPAALLIERLEQALSFQEGELFACAHWDQTPIPIREDLKELRSRDASVSKLAKVLSEHGRGGVSLDQLYESGKLAQLIDQIDPKSQDEQEQDDDGVLGEVGHVGHVGHAGHVGRAGESEGVDMLPMEVPLINKVPAGKPAGFTDLGYPARIADEYVRSPNLSDPDAFAAKVVGDSMEPSFHEGDIVVFSPAREVSDGMDCFVRFENEDESTFKRVYFQKDEAGQEMIRVQPINNRYPAMVVPREEIAGLYAGVSVTRSIG